MNLEKPVTSCVLLLFLSMPCFSRPVEHSVVQSSRSKRFIQPYLNVGLGLRLPEIGWGRPHPYPQPYGPLYHDSFRPFSPQFGVQPVGVHGQGVPGAGLPLGLPSGGGFFNLGGTGGQVPLPPTPGLAANGPTAAHGPIGFGGGPSSPPDGVFGVGGPVGVGGNAPLGFGLGGPSARLPFGKWSLCQLYFLLRLDSR